MDIELDLNKFRTLIPISSLYEDSLLYLARNTRVEQLQRGDRLFEIGDEDPYSIFLLAGGVRETSSRMHDAEIFAGSEEALYALANFKPRQFQAEVITPTATIARVDSNLLEKLLAWGQFAPDLPPTLGERPTVGPNAEDSEWMMSMLQTTAFLRLPSGNIHALFSRLQEVPVKAGDLIVEMGAPGDYYYMIKKGRCKVFRPVGSHGENLLAELGPCASFGEEALVSDAPRNASVKMLTDGILMRLSKKDFTELLEEPLLNWVEGQEAADLLADGAVRVDVRLESEFRKSALPGAINIPLHRFRSRAPSLDRTKKYILYCDTGQRSSAAAFLLGQLGFDVYVLKGGYSHSHDEA
ncbi:MAG TPA: cyclic nucleotide-binding domain-containing protein [Sedimenticola thiotaurini]|uniref:Cyclic nucleotide-binding domain-containing protein n=1 Tax=Sedimenticola thiotaurini TaxID=1543721 RepID=A0A831RJL5_9GAMM|nr:cyclic nucleotide-binding domain-containing protein [Sedimenticola thiotaurini]